MDVCAGLADLPGCRRFSVLLRARICTLDSDAALVMPWG